MFVSVVALAGCATPAPLPTAVQTPPATTEATATPTPSPTAPTEPQDAGKRDGAAGEAEIMGDGSFRYVIVEGDSLAQVAARFGVSPSWIRQESGGRVSENLPIYPGEVLIIRAG